MNSSGIKRGLATTAVAALAVTGLPFLATSANATPLAEQEAPSNVTLQTTEGGVASFKNDGVDNTVHLVATGGSNVTQVQFSYSTNAGTTWTNIGTPTSRVSGAFSTEWAPPSAIFNTSVQIRAEALNSISVAIDTDVNVAVLVTANAESVDIAYAPGDSVGYFDQPYAGETQTNRLAAISGTTSDLAGNPTLTFSTPYNAVTTTEDVAGTVAPGATSRTYSGPINLNGYPVDAVAPLLDQAIFRATAAGDDAEPVVLNKQTITTVTAVATPATVQSGAESDITVTVLDAAGKPVVGAQVVAETADTDWTVGEAGAKYTNSQGKAVFAGADGAGTPGKTYSFIVNTTDDNGFDAATDFRRTATVTSYAPTATTITSSSKDGNAFDVDEAGANDLTAVVKDQSGAPLAGQTVSYSLSIVRFVAPVPPATTPAPTTGSAVTDSNGVVSIPFVDKGNGTYTLKTFVERDGTPGQSAGDLAAADLVFKAGDSTLKFTEAPTATSIAGTTDTYDAALKLSDGTPLPGRAVRFSFTQAGGGNVVVAAQGNQPAGTTRVSDTQADDVTDASGTVTVALSDPATPDEAELNGILDANTMANTIGNANENADDLDVDFVDSTPPALTTITIANDTATHKPGVLTSGSLTVVADADGNPATPGTSPVVGQAVTLTVDKGFFTDGSADPAPAAGADTNEYKSSGQTITVVTGAGGVANFQTTIERDSGFDDDGAVVQTVTATAGSFSDTEAYDYSSANPLNGGAVELVLSPDALQQSGVLPKAPVDDNVAFDVFVTDQFGNRVDGVVVDLSDNFGGATLSSATATADLVLDGDFWAEGTSAGDQKVTASWTKATSVYNTATPPVASVGTETLKDDFTVNWYTVDYANSTFTLSHTGTGVQPVGSTVTETYTAIDQNGEEISDLYVSFFRAGPDDLQDGEGNFNGVLGQDGQIQYVFQGAKEGTATITAIAREDTAAGAIIPAAQKSDSVTFGTTTQGPVAIVAKLTGKNLGAKDRLKVNAPSIAQGAEVRLYKVVAGKRIQVGSTRSLNRFGNLVFTVKDRNRSKVTNYVAVVVKTAKTLSDTTNRVRVR